MKRLILLLLVMSCAYGAFAQEPSTNGEQWRPFTPAYEAFTTEVPVDMHSLPTSEKLLNRRYSGSLGTTYFFVFSGKVADTRSLAIAPMKFIRSYEPTGASGDIQGVSTENFAFSDDEGYYHRAAYCKVGSREYVFHTISRESADPRVERFFSKLTISKPEEPGPDSDTAPGENAKDAPVLPPAPQRPYSGGSGSGIAGENAGGVSAVPVRPANVGGNSSLAILSKPRPAYSDIARLYGVSGTVRLRVTFLADGSIGAITPVTFLPLGLTNNAVAAARNLKFTPAMENGSPIAVTKLVEYGFYIY